MKFLNFFQNKYILIISFVFLVFLITHVSYLNFIIFFSWVPILILLINFNFIKSLSFTFIASFISYAISFNWLLKDKTITFVLGSLSFILPIIFFVLFFNLYRNFFYKKENNDLFYSILVFLCPAFWLLLNIIFEKFGFFSFWMNHAIFFPLSAPLIWFIKSKGITFLIVIFNLLIVTIFYLNSKRIKKFFLALIFILILVFSSCFLFSFFSVPENDKLINIAIVQGVTNFDWGYRFRKANSILNLYKDMTLSINNIADLVVWPEYSVLKDPVKDRHFLNNLMKFSDKINSSIILGVPVFNGSRIAHSHPKYDAALFVNNDSYKLIYAEKVAPYDESVLVINNNSRIFSINNLDIGVLLCWEETQSGVINKMMKQNPDIVVSLANDQRFDNTSGIYLSSLYSRVYAAENKIFWIRSTNTGISQIINPNGKIIARLPLLERKILLITNTGISQIINTNVKMKKSIFDIF